MARVDDVAAYILSKFDSPITTMKLQKLAYMAHGWSLAILGEPLVDEGFQAWKNGPVCYPLFRLHRGRYVMESIEQGDTSRLTVLEKIVLDGAIKNYGGLTGAQLGEKTHQSGTPWSRARNGAVDGAPGSAMISNTDIASHFREILGLRAST